MAYLHCHSCDWEQDDFWGGRDYPIRQDTIEWLRDLLLRDTVVISLGCDGPEKETDTREVVAYELERLARRIRNMHVKTEDEFKKIKHIFTCPKCGSKSWDID